MQTATAKTATTSSNEPNYLGNSDEFGESQEPPDIAKLNTYYFDGDSCDQDTFVEMRSNILLVAGEHYNRRQSRFYRRIRDSRELSQEQKLRLTKNHTRKICQIYANNIVSANPNVGFTPKDEQSMHDQKVADLHHSVWVDAYKRYAIDDKIDDWTDSFVQIGECHVKLFYDPFKGAMKGFQPQIDPETGNPSVNEFGQMFPDEGKPVFEGEFIWEEIYGFNLLRPPECKDLRTAEWLCARKMVAREELLRKYKGDEEKQKFIRADQDETYVIFDTRGGYRKTTRQTMLREYFFRPSMLFPSGYFYITTKEGILEEGELPGGFFPIVSVLFDKIQTTARGHSPIKVMRPYQAEINRAASKIAEHQITLGDDKILTQNGTKISAGVSLPGVRAVNFTGAEPKILPGRDGSQYLNYMQTQTAELYQVMMVAEQAEDNDQSKLDPYVLLFRSARQKKKFQRYIKRMEKFIIELVHLYLRLAKIHMPDDAVVWAIGKNEQVNISEFRQLPDTCYEVNIEAQADDIETKLGKQMVLNHALQYVGPQLKPEMIGKIMRQMPFSNFDQSFDDLTIDYDSVMNDMLALDRGEKPPVGQYDDHKYCIKRLTARMRKADFKILPPAIQQAYNQKVALHQQMEAAAQLAIQRAEQGFIPTGGYMVVCDFYVKDPSDPSGLKTRRARVPYQSMEWLLNQLESQGGSQQQLTDMNEGALAQISQKFTQMGGGQRPGAQPPDPNQMMNAKLAGGNGFQSPMMNF
jgi:hypothetical protein